MVQLANVTNNPSEEARSSPQTVWSYSLLNLAIHFGVLQNKDMLLSNS